jgi:hypothetical protein
LPRFCAENFLVFGRQIQEISDLSQSAEETGGESGFELAGPFFRSPQIAL